MVKWRGRGGKGKVKRRLVERGFLGVESFERSEVSKRLAGRLM